MSRPAALRREDGQTLAFVKLTSTGEVLWVHEIRSDGFVADLGTSGLGTVVVVVANVSAGTTWGRDTLDRGAALLTLEATGAERWARNLRGSAYAADVLAVQDSGEAVLVTTSRTKAYVERYALTGERLWTHTLEIRNPDRAIW